MPDKVIKWLETLSKIALIGIACDAFLMCLIIAIGLVQMVLFGPSVQVGWFMEVFVRVLVAFTVVNVFAAGVVGVSLIVCEEING